MMQGEALNTTLRDAMRAKNLRPAKLAALVHVTPVTVERWLSREGSKPHPQTRAAVSYHLGVPEEMLWPSTKTLIKSGPDREVVSMYPYRSACPTSVWAELVEGADKELFFAGYTNYFLFTQMAAFDRTLREKASAGVRIRFLLGDPDGEVTRQREEIEGVALSVSMRIRSCMENLARLGNLAGLEVRYSAPEDAMNHVGLSVFRFDDDALVTPHLARLVGHDSPMMHLRKRKEHSMFDRFAEHAEELWERGQPAT